MPGTRRTITQVGRRSRFARVGSAVSPSGSARPGSRFVLPPRNYAQGPRPGSYSLRASGVTAHTHSHDALLNLLNDDHSQYILAPRAKLRIVAPDGAPYDDPKAAIEDCDAGDCVLILAGIYELDETITLPANNITIRGANRDGVVLHFTAADANHCLAAAVRHGICFQDFTVTAVAGKSGYGLSFTTCDDAQVQNVQVIADDLVRAVNVATSDRTCIDHCRLVGGFSAGIFLVAVNDASVGHDIIDITAAGAVFALQADDVDRLRLYENTIVMSGAAVTRCIQVYDSDNVRIMENYLRFDDPSAPRGIYIRAHSDGVNIGPIVADNIVVGDGDVGEGIVFASGGDPQFLDESVCHGNQVFNFDDGVWMANADVRETTVNDNNLHTNTNPVTDVGMNTSQADNH